MLPLRISELEAIGIIGVPANEGELIELTNLTERNIDYINNNTNFGFKIENGKYYMLTIFSDRPIGHTCEGLSFQPNVDVSLITNEESKAEYLKRDVIYKNVSTIRKMEIKDVVLGLMQKYNYTSASQVEEAIRSGDFRFATELYTAFGMCNQKPQSVEKYSKNDGVVIYSGARDVNDKIGRLRNGNYPFTEQSTFGFGYYFSDSLYTPRKYAEKIEENIIEARLDPSANVITGNQLNSILPMMFDNMPQNDDWKLVSEVLQIPELCTLGATLLNCDCLTVNGNYGAAETYYIPTNLDKVTLSNEPLYVNSLNNDDTSNSESDSDM